MRRMMLLLLAFFAWATGPLNAEDARPATSRMLPAQGLTFYVEYDGLDSHDQAWKATAANAMINRLPTGLMVAEISKQVIDRVGKLMPESKVSGADLVALYDHLFRNGFTIAVYDHGKGVGSGVLILRGFGRKEVIERFAPMIRLIGENDGQKLPASVRFRGRDVFRTPPSAEAKPEAEDPSDSTETWWFEGDDLVIIEGPASPLPGEKRADPVPGEAGPSVDSVALVLDTIEGKSPNASTHPAHKAALAQGRNIAGFESNGIFFLEPINDGALLAEMLTGFDPPVQGIEALIQPPGRAAVAAAAEPDAGAKLAVAAETMETMKKLGLDQVKRMVGRWGFQGKALLCDVKVEIPSPRKGLLAFLDQPGFSKDKLPTFPKSTGGFALGSFDPAKTWDSGIAWLKSTDLVAAGDIETSVQAIEKTVTDLTGQKLREDLLRHLGPTWTVYAAADPTRPKSEDALPTLLIDVDDVDAFGKVLDAVAEQINKALRDAQGAKPDDLDAIALVRLPAPVRGYRLSSPAGLISWLDDNYEPTILVGKSHLILAANPDVAMVALAAESRPEERWSPDGELAEALACLPLKLTSLSVGNPRDSGWPDQLANLPKTVQSLGGFLDVQMPAPAAAEAEPVKGSEILTLLGIPRAGGFRVRVDRAKVPRADDIRALLFPSVLATVVDDAGIRFISREAVPWACLGAKSNSGLAAKRGEAFNIKVNLGPGK